jgi:hypothetical protein
MVRQTFHLVVGKEECPSSGSKRDPSSDVRKSYSRSAGVGLVRVAGRVQLMEVISARV